MDALSGLQDAGNLSQGTGIPDVSGGGGGITDFFKNNSGLFGALGALGAGGALAYGLSQGGGGLPYAPQMLNSAGGIDTAIGGINSAIGGINTASSGITPQIANLTGVGATAGNRSDALNNIGINEITAAAGGILPTGAEQSVQNQVNKAKQTAKARYAALGQTGSTMEGDALANIDNEASVLRFEESQKIAQLGLETTRQSLAALGLSGSSYASAGGLTADQGRLSASAGQMSANAGQLSAAQAKIYGGLMEAQLKDNSDITSMIGNFAKALGSAAALA